MTAAMAVIAVAVTRMPTSGTRCQAGAIAGMYVRRAARLRVRTVACSDGGRDVFTVPPVVVTFGIDHGGAS
jgi:hypothetical protein